MKLISKACFAGLFLSLLLVAGCLPGAPDSGSNGRTITVYGFSIMKEALDNEIYPAFKAKWKQEHGEDINFESSFAGSETVTNQILQGVPADIAILSIERDADRLVEGKAAATNWREMPNHGIVNETPFVILVRAREIQKRYTISPISESRASRLSTPILSARAVRSGRSSRSTARNSKNRKPRPAPPIGSGLCLLSRVSGKTSFRRPALPAKPEHNSSLGRATRLLHTNSRA